MIKEKHMDKLSEGCLKSSVKLVWWMCENWSTLQTRHEINSKFDIDENIKCHYTF